MVGVRGSSIRISKEDEAENGALEEPFSMIYKDKLPP